MPPSNVPASRRPVTKNSRSLCTSRLVASRLDPGLEAGVAVGLHVFFPLGGAGKIRFPVARVTRGGRPALRGAANGEPFQQPRVEADVELLRPAHAFQVILILPLQTNFDE